MANSEISNLISNIKQSSSCVNFLSQHAHINIHHPGQTISTPAFIRHGDKHPSFQVFDTLCIDYATGQHYDIINLAQLLYNLNFIDAITLLNNGVNPFAQEHKSSREKSQQLQQAHEQFDNLIAQWHNNLINPQQQKQQNSAIPLRRHIIC